MLRIAFIGLILLILIACTQQLRTDVSGVGESIPTGPDALSWDGKSLYIAKEGLISLLDRIDTGSALSIYGYEGHYFFDRNPITITSNENPPFVTGLAWQPSSDIPGGGYLWVADAANRRILKVTTMGDVVRKINSIQFYPEDMTFDGQYLWVADSKRNKIFKVATEDCSVLETFISPLNKPSGIAWDGKYIIIIGYETVSDQVGKAAIEEAPVQKIKILKLDPAKGKVVGEVISSRFLSSPSGMAWIDNYLWIADKNSGKIFKFVDRTIAYEDEKIYKVATTPTQKKLEIKEKITSEKELEEAKKAAEEARKAAEEAKKAAEAAKKAFELQQKK